MPWVTSDERDPRRGDRVLNVRGHKERPEQRPPAKDHALRAFWRRPRVRRPADIARLVVAGVALAALLVLAALDPAAIRWAADLLPSVRSTLPRTILSLLNALASAVMVAVLVAIVIDGLRTRRWALTCAAVAGVLAASSFLALSWLADLASGRELGGVLAGASGISAGLPVAVALALLVGADLHRQRWWATSRRTLAVSAVCALALGGLTVASLLYAVMIGITAGFGARVLTGVVPARPSGEVVRSVLRTAGFDVTGLSQSAHTAGRMRYTGSVPDDVQVNITVVDPDRGGVPFVLRVWRQIRLRTVAIGQPALTLRGQLERQALTGSLADSAGVPAPKVLALLATGPAFVLMERALIGTSLPHATDSGSSPALVEAFSALKKLHTAGVAHGSISADGVVLVSDGRAGFTDFSTAQPAATDLQRRLDMVALLVAAAAVSGAEAAVSALRSVNGSHTTAETQLAALIQPVILPRPLRRLVRGTTILDDLRVAILGAEGHVTTSDVPRVQRIRPRVVLSVVGGAVAAYLLATQLSQVSIGSVFRDANPGWFAVALCGSAVTYVGSAVALHAIVSTALPLVRTALVQLAASFVSLVTPPMVGHVGLNIRYLHKAGVPTALAASEVAIKETATVAITVPLLLVCGWISGTSGSRLSLAPSGTVLVVVAVACGLLAAFTLVPRTRRFLWDRTKPLIHDTLPQLIKTLSSPRRLAQALAGVLILNGGYVLALDASLRAFSAHLALPTLAVVYLIASTIGSAAPTPGGLGAVESALVAGLVGSAVPFAQAVTAVLAFRVATFWLPAALGWVAFVMLQRRDRI